MSGVDRMIGWVGALAAPPRKPDTLSFILQEAENQLTKVLSDLHT